MGGSTEFLNMTLVCDPLVAKAMPQLLSEWRMKKRWASLGAKARQLHHRILRSYLRTGGPPSVSAEDLPILDDLQRRDLVVMDGQTIAAAYPFSTGRTRHRVTINGMEVPCVCAIDALGVGAMATSSADVSSRCPVCDQEINVAIAADGLSVIETSHAAPVVWAGIVEISGCAADTQCQSMLMFCGHEHLGAWQQEFDAKPAGFAFSVAQAVQAGAAIFQPFLASDSGNLQNEKL